MKILSLSFPGRSAVLFVFFLFLGVSTILEATVKLPKIFRSYMVLQQDTDVNFWGSAAAGESVSVKGSWNNVTVSTVADSSGEWSLKLPTPVARTDGTSYTVTVTGSNTLIYSNVLVGEVWVLSGQSNMQLPLAGWDNAPVEGSAAAIADAQNYPDIRLMVVGNNSASTPQEDIVNNFWDTALRYWGKCSTSSVDQFSALGFFFGRHLYDNLGIPIGLIQCCWGGSSCEAWTSSEDLERVASYLTPDNPEEYQIPSALWNGMLKPVMPYTIRGVLWYQGETNIWHHEEVSQLFPQMIEGWRREWGQGDFPFYFAQLAPYNSTDYIVLPEIWEAQGSALFLPETGLAVTVDLIVNETDLANIHPRRKEPIGKRMALWARANVYGETDLAFSGPLYRSMEVEGNSIRLYFDHADSGLKSKDGGSLAWFEVAGANGTFYPATAVIDGSTVVVSSPSVSQPVQARYAWSYVASGDLFNNDDLPAAPFRTHPADYVVSNLGQAVKPVGADSNGFFVSNGRLFDGAGDLFHPIGVNNLHALHDGNGQDTAFDSLETIKTMSGSNIVRIVWKADVMSSYEFPALQLKKIISQSIDLGMVPMVTFQDAAGSSDAADLETLAKIWTHPEYLAVLRQYEDYLLINIAGEWGPTSAAAWRDACKDAIDIMRTRNGGTRATLVVDAADAGRDADSILDYGQELLNYDSQHNLLFSLHLYDTWLDTSAIDDAFDALKAAKLPVVISSFGWSRNGVDNIPVEHIMQRAVELGFGYIAWAWSGDSESADLNLTASNDWSTPTTFWGELVINGQYGIKHQARISPALASGNGNMNYEQWESLLFRNGDESAANEDFDDDSNSNWKEYLLGMNPLLNDSDLENKLIGNPQNRIFRTVVSTNSVTNGSVYLKTTTDLINWSAYSLEFDQSSSNWTLDEASSAVVLSEQKAYGDSWFLSFELMSETALFFQLVVESN